MNGLGLEGISHAYDGHPVLRDLFLAVAPGEVACLLGPSGCGKTTLLRLAAGLENLQKGWVTIGHRLVADAATGRHVPPEQRGVGLMFQDYALFPHLDILGNVTFGVQDLTPGRLAWITGAMERMHINGLANSYPHTLSGGQQQRVALLRALAPEPKVLLLDEPFSGLDVGIRSEVREETLNILKEAGVTTLLVTHRPEEAMFMADRIMVMNDGRIIQAGTPVETYFQPVNSFVATLFGPVNRLTGVVKDGEVETLLGTFDAPGMSNGVEAEILIRREGIRLSLTGNRPARVISARLLGATSHIGLALVQPNGDEIRLQSFVPGVFLPDIGAVVSIRVDRTKTFVFPLA